LNIAYLLVAIGLGVFVLAVWAMFWAIDSGQYDDLEAQGAAILDEEVPLEAVPGTASSGTFLEERD
jgi:cbb3-type cytochrome oxidase maturation protein